ncbi:universal stress protein [Pontibacter chitinilyticus]|uniref:universal stress protein n=1 Tax=Pontibacter chitinilyticus TaxID=2674989 RepID=UPI00321B6B5A
MKTLLVPIDYSEDALKALEMALDLASRMEAQLLLCHVYQPPVLISDVNEPVFALPEYETKQEALSKLRKFARLIKQNAGVAVPLRFTVRAGDVVDELLELIKARKVSMVVMGTRGGTSLLNKLLGTTTEELVQQAPCPVLAVPVNAEPGPVSRIVYATALKPTEADTLPVLLQIKRLLRAALTLLYVDTDGKMEPVNVAVCKNYLLQHVPDDEVSFVQIKSKHVAAGIEHYAKAYNADMVAFRVSEGAIWNELFHPSVCSRMLQELNIPILALPKHGKPVELITVRSEEDKTALPTADTGPTL